MTGSTYKRLTATKQWDHNDEKHFFQSQVYSDHFITVTLYDNGGFEQHHAEGYQHPSEKPEDTIKRLADRILDEHSFKEEENV